MRVTARLLRGVDPAPGMAWLDRSDRGASGDRRAHCKCHELG